MHEKSVGLTDEWYTPPEIFQWLGKTRLKKLNEKLFDLDPCSPGAEHWVPAKYVYTKNDDGLSKSWSGRVFMNPPFGGRNGHIPWLKKFIEHGNGIGISRAYTSSKWWHDYMPYMDAIFFPRGKTKFIRSDGTIGKSPGHGIAMFSKGKATTKALCDLEILGYGMTWEII